VGKRGAVLPAYRTAGEASAAAAQVQGSLGVEQDPTAAAFFDVDNTIMRGASIFRFAVGLARRRFFSLTEVVGFGRRQLKFVMSGSEDLEVDGSSGRFAALAGRYF